MKCDCRKIGTCRSPYSATSVTSPTIHFGSFRSVGHQGEVLFLYGFGGGKKKTIETPPRYHIASGGVIPKNAVINYNNLAWNYKNPTSTDFPILQGLLLPSITLLLERATCARNAL